MKSTDQPTSTDWAGLPEELLDLIVDSIIKLSDYIRFSVVCKSWLSAALHQRHRRSLDLQKQVPLLLIPTKDRSRERRGLYSVTENKVLDLQLKVPYDRRCSGSSFGWLATAEENLAITLINPFSGKTIQLTPVMNIPKYKHSKRNLFKYEYKVPKIILSCDPSLMPNDFVVLAIYSPYKRLAYIKPGQDSWTNVFNNGGSVLDGTIRFTDAIYYMGKFYVVDHYCCVRSIDVSGTKPQVIVVVPRTLECATAYIAVSSGGDLLLIQRFLDQEVDYEPLKTSGFKVFKLLGVGGAEQFAERVEIHSLGDDALFLGDNYSQSVMASKFSGCQPNCIYYTDSYFDCGPCCPFRDVGIYCMEDGNFSQHYQVDSRDNSMPPPIWISPLLP